MLEIIAYIFIVLSTSVGVMSLGLIAGFSPTLYLAQLTITSSDNKKRHYALALMTGVISAILFLVLIFQFFSLSTLLTFIDSTLTALIVNVTFNILVGACLVIGGLWYINSNGREIAPTNKESVQNKTSGLKAMVALGFMRTFISVSGITATFAVGNLISETSSSILERVFFNAVFLASCIAPFVLISQLTKNNPGFIKKSVKNVRIFFSKFNYRLVTGASSISIGFSIIVFNAIKMVVG